MRAQLDRLIEEEGRDVVMVLHSYGGVVGSEAVHASLGKSQRKIHFPFKLLTAPHSHAHHLSVRGPLVHSPESRLSKLVHGSF